MTQVLGVLCFICFFSVVSIDVLGDDSAQGGEEQGAFFFFFSLVH